MRYNLLKIIILLRVFSFAQTTCSLDPIFISSNKTGIFPDSATNFVQGTVGLEYNQNITVKVPLDTVSLGITFCFTRVELTSPGTFTNFNLPSGLNLVAGSTVTNSAGNYKYPGNANSCSIISGTPTSAGTYTVQFKVQPFLTTSFTGCPTTPTYTSGSGSLTSPTTLSYYVIKINPSTNVGLKGDLTNKSFGLVNLPNPFSEKTTLIFNTIDESNVHIKVYSILGETILDETIKSVYGENSYQINASKWVAGIYLCSVQYKDHREIKRLVLNN